MGKILLLIVLAVIVVAWFRARAGREDRGNGAGGQACDKAGDKAGGAAGAAQRPPAQVAPEQMVTCPQCGLNLPAGEAVFDSRGTPYCGAAHLEQTRARERR